MVVGAGCRKDEYFIYSENIGAVLEQFLVTEIEVPVLDKLQQVIGEELEEIGLRVPGGGYLVLVLLVDFEDIEDAEVKLEEAGRKFLNLAAEFLLKLLVVLGPDRDLGFRILLVRLDETLELGDDLSLAEGIDLILRAGI